MLQVVLFEPEIPPNTGNVMRLCANTGATLHLVRPLGFSLTDRRMRRAGLDYHDAARTRVHADWAAARSALAGRRVFAISTRAQRSYAELAYRATDALVFGPETRGLPEEVLTSFPEAQRLRVPMVSGSRSLNLANAVAVVVFEAWRQSGFPGGA